jgi:hypothetical protein
VHEVVAGDVALAAAVEEDFLAAEVEAAEVADEDSAEKRDHRTRLLVRRKRRKVLFVFGDLQYLQTI